jgi:hypothetical protein
MSSPRLTTALLPPATGTSFGETAAARASRLRREAPMRPGGWGKLQAHKREDPTPAHTGALRHVGAPCPWPVAHPPHKGQNRNRPDLRVAGKRGAGHAREQTVRTGPTQMLSWWRSARLALTKSGAPYGAHCQDVWCAAASGILLPARWLTEKVLARPFTLPLHSSSKLLNPLSHKRYRQRRSPDCSLRFCSSQRPLIPGRCLAREPNPTRLQNGSPSAAKTR